MDQDEIALFTETVRNVIEDAQPIAVLRALRDRAGGDSFDHEFWTCCVELGWAGILVDEDAGGSALGYVAAGHLARELGRQLTLSPFVACSMMSAAALWAADATLQMHGWLLRISAGEIIAPALSDTARHGESRETHAELSGDGIRLHGRKVAVPHPGEAVAFLISAVTEEGEDLFLVERGAPGLSCEKNQYSDGRAMGALLLDGVPVAKAARLGSQALTAALHAGWAGYAARQVGLAEECFRRTLEYTRQRRQFDRTIGSFQALQHRIVGLHCDIEDAWSATRDALQRLDAGADGADLAVAVAKAKAARTACVVTAECLQLHGGIGMTDEFDIGLFLKQGRLESELLGGYAFHAERSARLLGF